MSRKRRRSRSGANEPGGTPLGPTPAEDTISTIFFSAHELANLVAFIAACGPYAPRDGARIYGRVAADYSVYNACAWQIRYREPILATVPHDEKAIECAAPRIPDLHRALGTAVLLAYNLDEFVDDAKALGATNQLVIGTLLALRRCLPGGG